MSSFFLKDILGNDIVLTIDFKNLTSSTAEIKNVQISSVGPSDCNLILPLKSCAKGHQVSLYVCINAHLEKKHKKKKIIILGKIVTFEQIDNKTCEVNIQFNQFIKEEWDWVINNLKKKQQKISIIIDKLK